MELRSEPTGYEPSGELPVDEMEQQFIERPRLTVIAGGGGGAVVGPGLVEAYPNADITIIVGVGDRGGATEEVRALFGGPAPGDLRNNLAAVSGNAAGALLNRRFEAGQGLEAVGRLNQEFLEALDGDKHDKESVAATLDHVAQLSEYVIRRRQEAVVAGGDETAHLGGHTYGNLLLTALRLENDRDIAKAAEIANHWLETKATVMPSSIVSHDLILDDKGTIIVGEGDIDTYVPQHHAEAYVELEAEDPHSEVEMYQPAYDAVAEADTLIIAPGSIYSTQLGLLAIKDIELAIMEQEEHGKMVLMANIVEDPSAPGVGADMHVRKLHDKTQRPFDLILYNNDINALPENRVPLHVDEASLKGYARAVIGDALLSSEVVVHSGSDVVAAKGLRANTHHDVKTAANIMLAKSVVPLQAAA